MATISVPNNIQNGDDLDADNVMDNFDALVTSLTNDIVHKDGSVAFTGIPSLPASDPSTANQAVRKSYADALVARHLENGTAATPKRVTYGSTTLVFTSSATSAERSVAVSGSTGNVTAHFTPVNSAITIWMTQLDSPTGTFKIQGRADDGSVLNGSVTVYYTVIHSF